MQSGGRPEESSRCTRRVPHKVTLASLSSEFCGMTNVPRRQPTIVTAAMSLSTGTRSSPWKVGSDALTSSADAASARLRFLGAKLAKSCSSISSTNCNRANHRESSYRGAHAYDPHRRGDNEHPYSHPSCHARARPTLCRAPHPTVPRALAVHALQKPRMAWRKLERTSSAMQLRIRSLSLIDFPMNFAPP